MPMSEEKASLANLGGGAAIEKFDYELEKVLENIADINTTKDVRSISMTVSFKPNDDRTVCSVVVKCKSTLAGDKHFETSLFVTEGPGRRHEAFEYNPEQLRLDTGTVVPMQKIQIKKGETDDR